MKVRVGIVGYGAWVRSAYVPALRHDGRAEIVALSARSRGTLDQIDAAFGDAVELHPDFHDLIESPRVQAVMIAVPDPLHAEVLLAALRSGKPVFYEPPLADTREGIPVIAKQLLASRQITHADLELALVPAVGKASDWIHGGSIGRVQTATIRLQSNWGPEPDQDTSNINRLSVWYTHVLDVLLRTTPERVLVMDGSGVAGRRQSQSSGFFDYGGTWGELKVNTDSAEALSIQVDVVGDEGDLLVDLLSGQVSRRTKRSSEWHRERWPAAEPYADWPGVNESVAAFLDAVSSGNPSFANPDVVTRLHRVGMAAELSKETGTWADVPNAF